MIKTVPKPPRAEEALAVVQSRDPAGSTVSMSQVANIGAGVKGALGSHSLPRNVPFPRSRYPFGDP
jgi:hypothetical protein